MKRYFTYIVMISAMVSFAQANEPVNIYYDWNSPGISGWERSTSQAELLNTNNNLTMQYSSQSFPMPEKCNAYVTLPDNITVTNISLRFSASEQKPSYLMLVLHSTRDDSDWTLQIVPPDVGVWQSFSVPVEFSAGWTTGPGSDAVTFFNDMLEVDTVGVYVYRNGTRDEQNYQIDDFYVQAETQEYINDPPYDRDNDGMPDTWEDRYNLDMTNPADAEDDQDGDGMSNFAEYMAGTAPNDAGSLFTIESLVSGNGIAVKWQSIPDRIYKISRTTNLMYKFNVISAGITGTPPDNIYQDMTATNNGTYFYRVGVGK